MATSRPMSAAEIRRKTNKPIMEKKRRQRINKCLEELKKIVVAATVEGSRSNKLEKADILEMTVLYLQNLNTGPTNKQNCLEVKTRRVKPAAASKCLPQFSKNSSKDTNVIGSAKGHVKCKHGVMPHKLSCEEIMTLKQNRYVRSPETWKSNGKDSIRSCTNRSMTAHQLNCTFDAYCRFNQSDKIMLPSPFSTTNQRDNDFENILERPLFQQFDEHNNGYLSCPDQSSILSRSFSPVSSCYGFVCSKCKDENTGGKASNNHEFSNCETDKLSLQNQQCFQPVYQGNRQCNSNDSGRWSFGSRPSSTGPVWSHPSSCDSFDQSSTCKVDNGTYNNQLLWRPWET